MTAPAYAADVVARALGLTAAQGREFSTCAQACGLTLRDWLVQCAQVKAADVIDAIQAPTRAERLVWSAENAAVTARRHAERRATRLAQHGVPAVGDRWLQRSTGREVAVIGLTRRGARASDVRYRFTDTGKEVPVITWSDVVARAAARGLDVYRSDNEREASVAVDRVGGPGRRLARLIVCRYEDEDGERMVCAVAMAAIEAVS